MTNDYNLTKNCVDGGDCQQNNNRKIHVPAKRHLNEKCPSIDAHLDSSKTNKMVDFQ